MFCCRQWLSDWTIRGREGVESCELAFDRNRYRHRPDFSTRALLTSRCQCLGMICQQSLLRGFLPAVTCNDRPCRPSLHLQDVGSCAKAWVEKVRWHRRRLCLTPTREAKGPVYYYKSEFPSTSAQTMLTTMTEDAVASFFVPASKKAPERVTWRVIDDSLLTARFESGKINETIKRPTAGRRIAAFDLVRDRYQPCLCRQC